MKDRHIRLICLNCFQRSEIIHVEHSGFIHFWEQPCPPKLHAHRMTLLIKIHDISGLINSFCEITKTLSVRSSIEVKVIFLISQNVVITFIDTIRSSRQFYFPQLSQRRRNLRFSTTRAPFSTIIIFLFRLSIPKIILESLFNRKRSVVRFFVLLILKLSGKIRFWHQTEIKSIIECQQRWIEIGGASFAIQRRFMMFTNINVSKLLHRLISVNGYLTIYCILIIPPGIVLFE